MKLYAQMGYGPGGKVEKAIADGIIDGIIIGPKNSVPETTFNLATKVSALEKEVLFDPQLYALPYVDVTATRFDKIRQYEYFYDEYERLRFETLELLVPTIKTTLRYQNQLPLSYWVSPNLNLTSFNSRVASISLNFIRFATGATRDFISENNVENAPPLLISLPISVEALTETTELDNFLSEVTVWEESDRPAGFYVIVEKTPEDSNPCSYPVEAIGGLLNVVYSLYVNGFQVVVGYSDFFIPLVIATGAIAGATGWYEGEKTFSLGRFYLEPTFRARPKNRYTSAPLFHRILLGELTRIEEAGIVDISSRTPYETVFRTGDLSDVTPELEALQHWASIKSYFEDLTVGDVEGNLAILKAKLENARSNYQRIENRGITLESRSDSSHIIPLLSGIGNFEQRFGISVSPETE